MSFFENPELRIPALKLISLETFLQFPYEFRVKVFSTLVKLLPGIESSHSTIIHEIIDNLPIDSSILSKAVKGADINKVESLIEIIQYKYTQSSVELVESLFDLLKMVNDSDSLNDHEYLKQLILLALKIHVSHEKRFILRDSHLNTVIESMKNQTEFNLQTKQQALYALAGFATSKPGEVLKALQNLFVNTKAEKAADEYMLYKAAFRALVPALNSSEFSVEPLVSQLILFFNVIPLDIKEIEDIIRIGGNNFLFIALNYLSQKEYDFNLTHEFLLKFSIDEIISAFNKIISELKINQNISKNDFRILDMIGLEFNSNDFLVLIPKKREKASKILSEFIYNLFVLKHKSEESIGSGEKKAVSKGKSVKSQISKLSENMNRALDNETLSKSISIILQKAENKESIEVKKDVLEFLLKRLEMSKPGKFFALIPYLGSILELYVDKTKAIHKPQYETKAMYLQLILLTTYNLLKAYDEPNKFIEPYGKTLIEFTKTQSSEIKSSACLCFSVFFNNKSLEILPFIEEYVLQLTQLVNEEDEVVINCGISCFKNLFVGARDFLSPHIEDIIVNLSSIEHNTTELLSLIPNNISARIIINCLLNALERTKENVDALLRLLEMSRVLGEKITSQDAEAYKDILFSFYKEILALPENKQSELSLKEIKRLSKSASDSFSSFALSLTNQQLKPCFLEIAHWCLEKTESQEYSFHRLLSLFSITVSLAETLKSLFIPYYIYIFDVIVDLMNTVYEAYKEVSQKKKRNQSKLVLLVNSTILQAINKCAAHDKDKFLNADRCEKISAGLASQLKLVGLKNKYKSYTEANVLPTIHAIATSTHDQTVWQSLNFKILLNSRNENPDVRFLSLLSVNQVLMTLGKEYATLLPDIMPFVSEALEDDNDLVTNIAKAILTQLETLTGHEIREYIK